MGTQGLVTVIDKYGGVILKAVCGCDGYYARELAAEIRKLPSESQVDPKIIYSLARKAGFGSSQCLVVLTKDTVRTNCVTQIGDDPSLPLYHKTFGNPMFNPRWEHGNGAITEIVTNYEIWSEE